MNKRYHITFSLTELNSVLTSLYSSQLEKQEIYRKLIDSDIKEIESIKRYEKELTMIQNAIDQIKQAQFI